jgi:hypothetical protein
VSYGSVTRHLREARFPPSKPEPHSAGVQRDLDDSDQAILVALEDSPFASVRQLSRLTHLPSTTVYCRLTQSLGFVAHHLRWVPHALSDAQKGERINMPRRLLRMLEVQRDPAWHDIIILDELWFYLSTDYEFAWLPRDKKFLKENDTQFNRKIHGHNHLESARVPFHQSSQKSCKFNADCYIVAILDPWCQWRSIEVAGNERKLLVHADNAHLHTAKLSTQFFNENRTKSAPQSIYCADLTPSDFYPFGDVKRCLAWLSFEEADQLLPALEGVPEGIEK